MLMNVEENGSSFVETMGQRDRVVFNAHLDHVHFVVPSVFQSAVKIGLRQWYLFA